MGYPIRHGLIVTNGSPKHHMLVSSIARFLIKKMDASPLDIYTEHKIDKFRFDVRWQDRLFEAETSVRSSGLNRKKMECLRKNGTKVTLVFPFRGSSVRAASLLNYRRWADVIEEVWLLDENDADLVKVFGIPKISA